MKQNPEMQLQQVQEGKRILIVDDEAVIRDLCARALKEYRVVQAADGEEALNIYLQGGIDVILTDVMMPRMDGLELLKQVKEREPTAVVLIMTGFADKDVILNALKADADDFITKPLNLLQLKTAVQKALDRKALKEEIASLKSVDRIKSEFLSMVSHKFRTPLTAISLFLQNVASGVFDSSAADDQEHVKLIYAESCYLEQLVADLLEFSRMMDTGKGLQRVPCSLAPLIREVANRSRQTYPGSGGELTFELQSLPPVDLDCEKIVFAFKQVIDNACKFCQYGGISIVLREVDAGIELIVADEGPGIPAGELTKIFEKFYQVDSHKTGQVRGFGLGLTYAREFIQMHGGTITIQSELGKGTQVTIVLPAQKSKRNEE